VGSIKAESKPGCEIDTSGYVPENPCPYGISAPRRRSQPIRIHRSSSSRSTRPANINSPAAINSSPRRAVSPNHQPAIVPGWGLSITVITTPETTNVLPVEVSLT
jgi:hypothetical protein